MLGLFDSGNGGLNTVRYVKKNMPDLDLVYKIDRLNSPYGIKNEKELVEIVKNNLNELIERGAERVLIACCTASTVYCLLEEEYKRISIPIIEPVARSAMKASRTGCVGVIGTKRTVDSHAFRDAMKKYRVTEIEAQELVRLIDGGLTDESATIGDEEYLDKIVSPFKGKNIDTLILGCTHFPALKKTFLRVCRPIGIKHVIDSAKVGALAMCYPISKEK